MDREETLSPGAVLGPYRVVRRVGRGTFSEVYEALKHPLNRRVALKVLRRDHAGQPEAVARFEREASIAAGFDHPHIVKVLETGAIDGVRVHEMEFLDGPTLSQVIRAGGPMAVGAVCDVAAPLVSAVAALHDRGFVHRDLKPGNVILAERRKGLAEPVLIDFGIVKAPDGPSDTELTRTHALLGSPGYMSPEQARESRGLDHRSDQFSLGIIGSGRCSWSARSRSSAASPTRPAPPPRAARWRRSTWTSMWSPRPRRSPSTAASAQALGYVSREVEFTDAPPLAEIVLVPTAPIPPR